MPAYSLRLMFIGPEPDAAEIQALVCRVVKINQTPDGDEAIRRFKETVEEIRHEPSMGMVMASLEFEGPYHRQRGRHK